MPGTQTNDLIDQYLFRQEVARGEKVGWIFRWFMYGLVFVLANLVWHVQDSRAGVYGVALAGAALLYNCLITPLVLKSRTTLWIRYVSVLVDICCLTLYNAADTVVNSALAPVTTSALLLYPVLIFIASLRQDPRLVVFATAVSLLAMNTLWLLARPYMDPQLASALVSADLLGQVYRSAYIVLFGGLVFFIPATITRLLHHQKTMLAQAQTAEALARMDALTGLANRLSLTEDLDKSISMARRSGTRVGLIFIDLDGFKPINDTYGHQSGDLVLTVIASRIKSELRDFDLAARVGGDEFVVLIKGIDSADSAQGVARRILARIREPYRLGHRMVKAGASLGVALYPDHAQDGASLLAAADKAMYHVKHRGKNAVGIAETTSFQPSPEHATGVPSDPV